MTQITDNSFDDPLTRVIDAFVDQSVPEGPDDATQRRLVAALVAADRAPAVREQPTVAMRRRVRPRARVGWGLAAAATMAAAAVGVNSILDRQREPNPVAQVKQDSTIESPQDSDDAQLERLVKSLQLHLRLDRGRAIERRDVIELASAVIQANPKLAKSQSWRVAQEKLTDALERPELIGLGVGVLSTLPLTSARF